MGIGHKTCKVKTWDFISWNSFVSKHFYPYIDKITGCPQSQKETTQTLVRRLACSSPERPLTSCNSVFEIEIIDHNTKYYVMQYDWIDTNARCRYNKRLQSLVHHHSTWTIYRCTQLLFYALDRGGHDEWGQCHRLLHSLCALYTQWQKNLTKETSGKGAFIVLEAFSLKFTCGRIASSQLMDRGNLL